MAGENDKPNYRSFAQDSRYEPLVKRGIISSGQACVLRELEKIDGTQFRYVGPETRPDMAGEIFRDSQGREASTILPRHDQTVQYETPDNKRDIVDPRGAVTGRGSFETRHYDNITDTHAGTARAEIRGGVAEPAGRRDALGTPFRELNERERTIHERTQACFAPKIS